MSALGTMATAEERMHVALAVVVMTSLLPTVDSLVAVYSLKPDLTIGCFRDNSADRDLPVNISASIPNNTLEVCARKCFHRGFTYAGAQNGSQCFCGNAYGKYNGSSTACNVTCPGAPGLVFCGGLLANMVVYTGYGSSGALVGCFADSTSERDLRIRISRSSLFDPARNEYRMCAGNCFNQSYQYAGLQLGWMCFCGNSTQKVGSHRCTMRCPGDTKQSTLCGGRLANNIVTTGLMAPGSQLGCWKDNSTQRDRDLNTTAATQSNKISQTACVAACYLMNFQYAGSQNGGECYCGQTYGNYTQRTNDVCNMPCSADATGTTVCGGGDANLIMFTGYLPPPSSHL